MTPAPLRLVGGTEKSPAAFTVELPQPVADALLRERTTKAVPVELVLADLVQRVRKLDRENYRLRQRVVVLEAVLSDARTSYARRLELAERAAAKRK